MIFPWHSPWHVPSATEGGEPVTWERTEGVRLLLSLIGCALVAYYVARMTWKL